MLTARTLRLAQVPSNTHPSTPDCSLSHPRGQNRANVDHQQCARVTQRRKTALEARLTAQSAPHQPLPLLLRIYLILPACFSSFLASHSVAFPILKLPLALGLLILGLSTPPFLYQASSSRFPNVEIKRSICRCMVISFFAFPLSRSLSFVPLGCDSYVPTFSVLHRLQFPLRQDRALTIRTRRPTAHIEHQLIRHRSGIAPCGERILIPG